MESAFSSGLEHAGALEEARRLGRLGKPGSATGSSFGEGLGEGDGELIGEPAEISVCTVLL